MFCSDIGVREHYHGQRHIIDAWRCKKLYFFGSYGRKRQRGAPARASAGTRLEHLENFLRFGWSCSYLWLFPLYIQLCVPSFLLLFPSPAVVGVGDTNFDSSPLTAQALCVLCVMLKKHNVLVGSSRGECVLALSWSLCSA